MPKNFTISITPAFEPEVIIQETLGKLWSGFKIEAGLKLPKLITNYMQDTIKGRTKRSRSTGNLAKSMKHCPIAWTEMMLHWGIGHIPTLKTEVPYYKIINYGGVPPAGGMYRPVMFGNQRADPSLRGNAPKGSPRASKVRMIMSQNEKVPSPIRPMNYLESTNLKLQIEVRRLLAKLKRM